MAKVRLDQYMAQTGLVSSRSQAESYIRLGQVKVAGTVITKPGHMVDTETRVILSADEQYVSRAALKLKSAADTFKLDFRGKTVLDVGSSTGGFTQFALLHGAKQVIAVDVGSNQLHASLRGDERIELHEKTDIRDFATSRHIDIIVGDVSFISLREILPHVSSLMSSGTILVAMVKPQFEAGQNDLKHKGVIKNDRMRRDILKSFEQWAQGRFVLIAKADSAITGAKGNLERFYMMKKLS